MAPFLALLGFIALSLVVMYALGTLGLGVAIFLLCGYMLASELLKDRPA